MFGEALKKLRKQRDISQRALAELVGVDYTYISKIESGALNPPSEDTLIKMAKALDVDRYDFIMLAGKIPTDFEHAIRENKDIQKALKEIIMKKYGR
jgi:transcriptional regulator with XRE-family HTH domain